EGGTVTSTGKSKCSSEVCTPHFIYMIDKGEMLFDGEYREYVTLVSSTFGFDLYYIYLKDIGLYGTHYMNLVDYEIINRVDVAAVAAALEEPEEPEEVVKQPTSSGSSSSGGGAANLFWLLIAGFALSFRRRQLTA
ncbi:MAG: hypothetical protein VW258_15780, partial [Thalassolituus sp.]